jgi:hypothetical protein
MRHRVAVHAGAPLVVLALFGCTAILARRSRWAKAGAAILGILAVLPMPVIILLQSRPPHRTPDTRAVLETLATRLDEGDRVYVYCYAEAAAEYYGPGAGIPGAETLDCPDSEREVEQMIGTIEPGRVWLFYNNMPEPVWSDVAIRALAERGAELERITDPWVGAEASETAAVLFELE